MILGLDLSSSCTGFGILHPDKKVEEFGQIKPKGSMTHGQKYSFICDKVDELIDEFKVDMIVLEGYFAGGMKTTGTLICTELRGAIKCMVADKHSNVNIVEDIVPSSLKLTIAGSGRASKRQVCEAIMGKLGIEITDIKETFSTNKKTGITKAIKCRFTIGEETYQDDVSDALSLAYCHLLKGRE